MKKNFTKIVLICSNIFFFSCGNSEEKPIKEDAKVIVDIDPIKVGETIFTDKGCIACHQPDKKIIGPSIKDISVAYNSNPEGMKAFLKEEGEAIVEPDLFPTMQVNLAITKEMSEEDLNSLVEYMLSF